jgi:hypothetical protein
MSGWGALPSAGQALVLLRPLEEAGVPVVGGEAFTEAVGRAAQRRRLLRALVADGGRAWLGSPSALRRAKLARRTCTFFVVGLCSLSGPAYARALPWVPERTVPSWLALGSRHVRGVFWDGRLGQDASSLPKLGRRHADRVPFPPSPPTPPQSCPAST